VSFIKIKPEKVEQIKVGIIFIIASVLIGYGSVHFVKYIYIIPVLIFVCLFALLTIYRFEIALFFTLFMFPLIPKYLGIDLSTLLVHGLPIINTQRILLGTLLLGWVLRKAMSRDRFSKTPLSKLILILFLVQAFSVFTAVDKRVALLHLFSYLFEYYLVFYMIFDVIRTKEQIKKTMVVIIVSAGIIGIIGLTEYISGHNFYSVVTPVRELMGSAINIQERLGVKRVEISFGHAISCGMYLVLVIPISFFFLSCAKSGFMKAIWWIFSLMLLIVLYLTRSRGPWVGLMGAMMWVLLIGKYVPKYRKRILVTGLLVCLFLVQPFFFQAKIHKLKTLVLVSLAPSAYLGSERSEATSSITGRVIALKATIEKISKRPIGGYGLKRTPTEIIGVGADINYYVRLPLESGLFALLLFGLILFKIFRVLWNCCKKAEKEEDRMLATALLASLIGLLIVLGTVTLHEVFWLFWILVGIGMRLGVNQLEGEYFNGKGIKRVEGILPGEIS